MIGTGEVAAGSAAQSAYDSVSDMLAESKTAFCRRAVSRMGSGLVCSAADSRSGVLRHMLSGLGLESKVWGNCCDSDGVGTCSGFDVVGQLGSDA